MHDPTAGGGAEPTRADRLALERTRLAMERTLLGWMRTAFSMTGFGFTIFKFVQYLRLVGKPPAQRTLLTANGFALLLIACSTILLILAVGEFRASQRWLVAQGARPLSRVVQLGAVLVIGIGIAAFVSVWLAPAG